MNVLMNEHTDTPEISAGRNQQTATTQIDKKSIREHIVTEVQHLKSFDVPGKIVVVGFGEEPDGKKLPPKVCHFDMNKDSDSLVNHVNNTVISLAQEKHCNIYMPLALMSGDLGNGKKGGIEDVISVFGLCADFDDENAHDYMNRLPMEPDYVLETSAGRYQAFFLFTEPVSPDEAIPVAAKLKECANCDHGTKDISHVWRIPGTLNWPNKKKVDEGRPRQPQLVTFAWKKESTYGK